MVKNKKGGNKCKKGKNSVATSAKVMEAEEGQYYAIVQKIIGNSIAQVKYFEPGVGIKTINGIMRKSLKKKRMYVNPDKYIIISLREFETSKCDIIHVYRDTEMNYVKRRLLHPNLENSENKSNHEDLEFINMCEEEEEVVVKPKKISNSSRIVTNYDLIPGYESSEEEDED